MEKKLISPVVYLHPDEKYFPSSVEYIYQNSPIVSEGKIICPKGTTPEQAPSLLDGHPNPYLDIPEKIYPGEENIDQVPIYHTTNNNDPLYNTHIYIFVYPYNGPYNILGVNVGSHPGDIEHITVKTNKENDSEIVKAYYSTHSSGTWLNRDELEFEDEHLVVYSAKGSHACYWKSGFWPRIGCVANDFTGKGKRWGNIIIDIDNITQWNNNYISLGSQTPPLYRSWWHNEDTKSENSFDRLFVCC